MLEVCNDKDSTVLPVYHDIMQTGVATYNISY